MACTWNSPG